MRRIVTEWMPPPEDGFTYLDELAKMFDCTVGAVKSFIKFGGPSRPEVVLISVKNRRVFYRRDEAIAFMQTYGRRRNWSPPKSLDVMHISKAARAFDVLESDVRLVFKKHSKEAPKAVVVDIKKRRPYYPRKELLAFLSNHLISKRKNKDVTDHIHYGTYHSDAAINQYAKDFCKPKVRR